MTREEILNTPEIVDFMLDKSVMVESKMKLHKRLDELCKLAIKALEQEPFINKPCISSGVCEHDKNKVLDNIRAEIEKYKSTIDNAISEDELKIEGMKEAYTDCLNIIDKYKAESEE